MIKLKSKKGFTLVELSIVIALIGMVASMVTVFIATYHKHTFDLIRDRQAMSEITDIKRDIENFIKENDKSGNTFAISENGEKLSVNGNSISVTDGCLVKNGTERGGYDAVKSCSFSFDTVDSKENKNVIRCRVYYDTSFEDLLFAVFSTTSRERFSPEDR